MRLTGRDSEKFVNQVVHGRPKQAAKDAYAAGKFLAKQMRSNRHATRHHLAGPLHRRHACPRGMAAPLATRPASVAFPF